MTTQHAARRLARYGFSTHGLDNWEAHTITRAQEALSMTSLPGVHARGLMGKILPSVMGTLLEHSYGGEVRRRIYLSGDTLTGDHLDVVRERYPQIDTAVVHLGGTRVLGRMVTMDGTQGVDFLGRVQPRAAVPVHYDDYHVFRSPLSDFRRPGQGRRFRRETAYGPARGDGDAGLTVPAKGGCVLDSAG